MNRKQFIESVGATCQNWTWSWSFINEQERLIIFGQWDIYQSAGLGLILSEDWKVNKEGKRLPGYTQAREHVRLIEEQGYRLQTFPMKYSAADADDDAGPAKISGFSAHLTPKQLIRIDSGWYAANAEGDWLLPEEIDTTYELREGASQTVTVNSYERNAAARDECIAHYGYSCAVCGFSLEQIYGPIGRETIHVHHLVPLSEMKGEYVVDPVKDLRPVCPNCHAMIHRTRPAQTIEALHAQLIKH